MEVDRLFEQLVRDPGDFLVADGAGLSQRVDGSGRVRWNSNLQRSQAAYVLLVESHVRGEAFGLAPDGEGD
ncbi:hypothetical protein [Halorubrum kocurii]|uniref:Uncharacterized protein n=1 Tax=Halorubrum kocurii JCM 14978 TaxID=1230456 RepID=M0P9L8_9EURY|nr:hypothetical protein [Halorubrum kocurii]EMA66269.1 hypothetical protein C468_04659 [Halorubrum kocurii JCM 14978]